MTSKARPTVYPRDLHLAENLSPEQAALRDAIISLERGTEPDGYEHTETVEAMEHVQYDGIKVARAFAALLNAEPAPAGVADREAAHLAGGKAYAEGGGPDDVVDAVPAALPTRTVAQVKAEAWDEGYAQGRLDSVDSVLGDTPSRTNPYRADELEREDKR